MLQYYICHERNATGAGRSEELSRPGPCVRTGTRDPELKIFGVTCRFFFVIVKSSRKEDLESYYRLRPVKPFVTSLHSVHAPFTPS